MLCDDSVTACLARDADRVVGVMVLNDCSAICAGGRFSEITELYITSESRSHGVAARLLECAMRDAKARGWHRLEVGAPAQPAWARTLQFYLCNGFKEVGPRLRRRL